MFICHLFSFVRCLVIWSIFQVGFSFFIVKFQELFVYFEQQSVL